MSSGRQLRHVRLRASSVVRRQAPIDQEIRAAISDLLAEHHFVPHDPPGEAPYDLTLGLEDHRLILELTVAADDTAEAQGWCHAVGLQPLRSLIRDYFIVCENYYAAVHAPNRTQLEAIDAGRRGLHNEAAQQLQSLLAEKVTIDHCTARRLFTLVAALHLGGWSNR